MIYLTILNSIGILYLLIKEHKLYVSIRKDKTFINRTLVGFHITLWKRTSEFSASGIYTLYIPIKNKKRVEFKEDIARLMKDNTNKHYTLRARFSWLKTQKEVKDFQKNYSVVDKDFVDQLVLKFNASL